jgi:hypothetical protein
MFLTNLHHFVSVQRDATVGHSQNRFVMHGTMNVKFNEPAHYVLPLHLSAARGKTVVKVYATNRKVAGSNPDGVIGIFH